MRTRPQRSVASRSTVSPWTVLVWLLSTVAFAKGTASPVCGTPPDRPLTASKGVITTPRFPGPFSVPIECEWVISNQSNNTIIEVYLTQLYILDGFTVTEYSYYGKDYDVPGREVFNKTHIAQYAQSMLSTQPYVVIRFKMDRLEGNHIRVYDDLMNVYGFNITYEVRPLNDERNDVCSLLKCSFSGNCLGNADLTLYSCSCFAGFFGSDCGFGPICKLDKNNESCENGGICRHAGRLIAVCTCPDGFTGGNCEVPVVKATSECGTSVHCMQQCSVNEDTTIANGPCSCRTYKNVSAPIDSRYHVEIKLVNITSLEDKDIKELLKQKIIKYFKKHSKTTCSSHEDCNLRITFVESSTGEVHFEFYSRKSDHKHVQGLLNSMISNGSLPGPRPVPLVKTSLSFHQETALWLSKIEVNKNPNVPEGEQFIISCIAQGSSSMQYRWFKDGYPVNESIATTRQIWTTVYKDKVEKNVMLVVEHADLMDTGTYTCELTDHTRQQCKSIKVSVIPFPEIIVRPTATVQKGDSLSIPCISKNEFKKFGYTWTSSSGGLVTMSPPELYWEDFHRGGSILYVNNIQQSEIYTCSAANNLSGKRNASMHVHVINTTDTAYCKPVDGWPLTLSGTIASIDCPNKSSTNYATRPCQLNSSNITEWQVPDYSSCAPDYLKKITKNFQIRTLGFERNVTATETLNLLYADISKTEEWHPGEGEPIVDFLRSVTKFLMKSAQLSDLDRATHSFNGILDVLLRNKSIAKVSKIAQMVEMVEEWTMLEAFYIVTSNGTKRFTNRITNLAIDSASEVVGESSKNITFTFFNHRNTTATAQLPKVVVSAYDIEIDKWINKSFNVGVITYNNLSQYFPKNYFLSPNGNDEFVFDLKTPIVKVIVARDGQRIHMPTMETTIDFVLKLPEINGTWNLTCTVTASTSQKWNETACRISEAGSPENVTRCHCPSAGLFAVFARAVPQIIETLKQDVIVIIGCVCCLIQSTIALILLFVHWIRHPTCILYLKIQLCLAIVAQMCMFLYAVQKNDYAYFSLCLQIVNIVEATSHLSQVLIVYTEIISFPMFPTIKLSIIGVATAAPVLFVLTIMLITNIVSVTPLRPWWSWVEKSAFLYIYFVLFVLLMLMYVSVLSISVSKMKFIKEKLQRNTPGCLKKWMGLIKRSVAVLLMVVATTVFSIQYFIYLEKHFNYIFSLSCALKGFVVLFCYILYTEEPINLKTVYRLKYPHDQSTGEIHSDSDGSLLNCLPKEIVEFETKQLAKSDILEIVDSPQEYFVNQGKPVSVVSNLTSSLKRTGHNSETKAKSVTFLHDLVTGCQVKPCINNNNNIQSGNNGKCSSYRNNSRAPLLETTVAEVVPVYGGCNAAESGGYGDGEEHWQVVQTDFEVPAGGDTAIRCVVQPPPDMLATHVCVEVGLVMSSALQQVTAEQNSDPPQPTVPTVVVCSVDVEPCRQPSQLLSSDDDGGCGGSGDNVKTPPEDDANDGHQEDDGNMFDRISQDLDYLLNRISPVDAAYSPSSSYVCLSPAATLSEDDNRHSHHRNRKPTSANRQDVGYGAAVQKRTNL
ncbi:uncharacterized protein LOC126838713 isoform X2 [Adelges cooleyi]|uniref:uncharacterized protein LOC126838713 isoform X2 n=1 Tax=Adelges cooleyi TaxID=133065 RepID=UPI0021809B44|nr:uncharacterized protein LOC126838713 isoform X2 [Adelges cooleyi]